MPRKKASHDPRRYRLGGGEMLKLWSEWGTPTQPHVDCPVCKTADEVGSHFDAAWCYSCGWKGSLTEVRLAAKAGRGDKGEG